MKSDFTDLIKRLIKAKVDFVIIGGFAGVVHGCTYVTQDMDICCNFTPENLLRLQKAISDFHPVHRMTPKRQKLHLTKENCKTLKNLYLDTDIGQLDCVSFVDGVGDYQQVKSSSSLVKVETLQLPILGLDALIKAKKAMNRPRDRIAVTQLETVKKLKKQKR